MFTKQDLKDAIAKYTNQDGSYFTPLLNTLCFWSSNTGRGVFRAVVKDSPQFKAIQNFMKTDAVRFLDDDSEIKFTSFYNYIVKHDRQHRFSTTYIYGDNAVATMIVKPWFESLPAKQQKKILKANDKVYKKSYKTITHHAAEMKDGARATVRSVARLATAPVESATNIYEALSHPINTADAILDNAYHRPAYTLGGHLPTAGVGHFFPAAGFVQAHVAPAAVVELNHTGEHHREHDQRLGH